MERFRLDQAIRTAAAGRVLDQIRRVNLYLNDQRSTKCFFRGCQK